MPTNLALAYRATDYVALDDSRSFLVRIGRHSLVIDGLLTKMKTRSGSFITAWNPFSKSQTADVNALRDRELKRYLRDRGFAFLAGEGRGETGEWPPEASIFAFGLSRSQAASIGRRFRQNAIVHVPLGRPTVFSAAFLLFAAALGIFGEFLQPFSSAPWIGWLFPYLSFRHVFFGTIGFAALCAFCVYVFTHLKWDFQLAGNDWRKSLRTIHLNDMWMTFYDTELDPNVAYARHAISIDENRANFQRVHWSSVKEAQKDPGGIQWFEQVWFPGNHSDIGGSYAENESRLSDISLDWLARWAAAVPHGLKFDHRVLQVWPYPDGPQHDEVAVGFGFIPRWTGITWAEEKRKLPGTAAVMHPSVYHRFDLPAAQVYGRRGPYRPETLQDHDDFKRFCLPGAQFPAKSFAGATVAAGNPPAMPAKLTVEPGTE